jgi:CubicO group peptidase (beta-lactamase class C family)
MGVRHVRNRVFSLFLASIASTQGAAAPSTGLDGEIEGIRKGISHVGVAVAVVEGDAVTYARGFGAREVGKPEKVDADTLFQIGSTSKAFTTAALGILAEEGKVRWDDAVIEHFPEFRVRDPWLTRELTVRDAISHRSGLLGDALFVMAVMDGDEGLRQLRYAEPTAAFRDSFVYSNPMYAVAGKVVARASGMSWGKFVQERLLSPLRMTRSGPSPYQFWDPQYVAPTFLGRASAARYSHTDAKDPNVAMPHVLDESGGVRVLAWQSYDNAAAAGSIVSSARDMGNWVILHLNGGRFEGRQVLREETVRELHRTQNPHTFPADPFPLDGTPEGYAMAWSKARYRGGMHLSHSGGIYGFPAYVAMLPQSRIGVVVLSNGPTLPGDMSVLHKAIAFHVFDRLLGVKPRPWGAEFSARARASAADAKAAQEKLLARRMPNAPPSLPIGQYAGGYEDLQAHNGRVSVRVEGERLHLSFAGEGAFSGFLEPWHHDVFRFHHRRGPDWTAFWADDDFPAFVLGADGEVVSMNFLDATFSRVSSEAQP